MSTRTRYLVAGGSLAAAAVILVALLALRGGGGEEVSTDSPAIVPPTSSTTTTTTEPSGPPAPLTGRPVADEAVLGRSALIVKVDNADELARPQAGLNQADVVYEEMVEGGVTRFAAVFHSQDAEEVGPIRSARSTDVAIAAPLNTPLFAFSGANTVFMELVRAAPLVELSYDWNPELYSRRADRRAPDDIFTPTAALWAVAPPEALPPGPLFRYRSPDDDLPADAVRVGGVLYHFGGPLAPSSYEWDPDDAVWTRSQNGSLHVDEDDEPLVSENLLIQFVDYVDTGLVDPAGTPVPEAQMVGEGDAWLFTEGHVVAGRWSRDAMGDVTRYTDGRGDEMMLTPGRTWVVLAPPGTAFYVPCPEASDPETPPACT